MQRFARLYREINFVVRLRTTELSRVNELQRANRELSQAYDTTLAGWTKALELRDKETEGHSRRVNDRILQLARSFGIPDPELPQIRRNCLDAGCRSCSDGQPDRKEAALADPFA